MNPGHLSPRRRAPWLVVTLILTALCLTSCATEPAPRPSPTAAFSSEEEAFAAAEEVYRKYNSAGNEGQDVTEFLVGAALESDIQSKRYLDENRLRLDGDSTIIEIKGTKSAISSSVGSVVIEVCLDVSASRVLDSAGNDVTPADRENRWVLSVTLVGARDQLLISDSTPVPGRTC